MTFTIPAGKFEGVDIRLATIEALHTTASQDSLIESLVMRAAVHQEIRRRKYIAMLTEKRRTTGKRKHAT